MSDYRKRPENDPWEDELDFLVWESIEKEREPERPPANRARSPLPPDETVDPRYGETPPPANRDFDEDLYRQSWEPSQIPGADAFLSAERPGIR